MPNEWFSIMVNAGGLGAVVLVIYTNQNWMRDQIKRIEDNVKDAHSRIDNILQGKHHHEP